MTIKNVAEERVIGEIQHAIRIDTYVDRGNLAEFMGSAEEGTLNSVLEAEAEAEADVSYKAKHYGRPAGHRDTPATSFRHKPSTKAGEVELKFTHRGTLRAKTQIVELYRRVNQC